MKSLFTCACLAAALTAHPALADPAAAPDAQEEARQRVLGSTPPPTARHGTSAATALAPADPQELHRRRVLGLPDSEAPLPPAAATGSSPALAPQEQARRAILGGSGEPQAMH